MYEHFLGYHIKNPWKLKTELVEQSKIWHKQLL